MSVYLAKRKDGSLKSPYWQFDVVIKINGESRRVHGSTGETTKKKAIEWERAEKTRLKSEKPLDHMTLNDACFRYEEEVGRHLASADDLAKCFEHCCRLIGGSRKLVNITTEDIATVVRRRSTETVGTKQPRLITGASVNRQIVEPMRRLLRRAHLVWKVSCDPTSIAWQQLKMREPKGRVRELSSQECDAFWPVLRADYHPLVWFLGNRGFRVRAAIAMKRADIDLDRATATIWMKGEGMRKMPLSPDQCKVIRAEMKKAAMPIVWTYEVQRGEHKGMRMPITYSGLRRIIRKALSEAGIADFRIHDLRHDFATKLLRHSRNLALVKTALGHGDISSTVRYAHVLDEEVAYGMQNMGSRIPEWSRNPVSKARKAKK